MLQSNKHVGRFMVAVGGVLQARNSKRVLLVQRSASLDWQPSEWEVIYGRLQQHETTDEGLRREYYEETKIAHFAIGQVLRIWHTYRGEQQPRSEMHGITFALEIDTELTPIISEEHQGFEWVTIDEAINRCQNEGVKIDLQTFKEQLC